MAFNRNPVKERIINNAVGWVFFPSDFYDISSPEATRQYLSRMVKNKQIVRIGQGIYCYPKSNKLLGLDVIPPTFDEIAKRVAQRDGVKIIPTGDYALNKIGLSTQVPTNAVYLTNGARKTISLANGTQIIFKESNEFRIFNFQSELMMLAVSAIRTIGEKMVTHEQLNHIKDLIGNIPEDIYKHDILLSPLWVRKKLEK